MRVFSAVPPGLDPGLDADPRLESLGYFQKSLRDRPKSEMLPLPSIGDFELEHVFRNHAPLLVTHLSPKRVGATARGEPFRAPQLPR